MDVLSIILHQALANLHLVQKQLINHIADL